ncbi:MATE family efflux transporter, partial [Xanthomonas sp. LMG 8992]|nr:MATE family efflux transporter [Xanthomonas sp. LMG 8992]
MSVSSAPPSATPASASELRPTGLLALPLVLGHVSPARIGFGDNVSAGHHGTATLAAVTIGTS